MAMAASEGRSVTKESKDCKGFIRGSNRTPRQESHPYRPISRLFCQLVFGFLALLLSVVPAYAWDEVGLNFRASEIFVSDGAEECFITHTDAYSGVTPLCTSGGDDVFAGFTAGTNIDSRDRDSAIDARLAGQAHDNESQTDITTIRLDLPTGGKTDCTIRSAHGDVNGSLGKTTFVRFCDGACGTPIATIDAAGGDANEWHDATGVLRTSVANWTGANAAITHTFTNSYLTVEISDADTDTYTPISHLFMSCVAPGPSDTICGVDTNNDGTADFACTGVTDADRDGYETADDCDDTDKTIYPGWGGRYTGDGCAANEYKECQDNGTFTACTNLSAFTGPTGTTSLKWISPSGNNANAGTFASPWLDYRCVTDSGLGCYTNPTAGLTVVFRAGTYTATWDTGSKQLYLDNKDGTEANPITFMGAPGEAVDIVGQGTTPTVIRPVHFVDSNYIRWLNIDSHGGYSDAGVYFNGGSDPLIAGSSLYNIDGLHSNNVAGVKISSGGDRAIVKGNRFYNNYDRANPTQENNYGLVVFTVDSITIEDNEFFGDNTNGCYLSAIKHGKSGGSAIWRRNVFYNSRCSAIVNEQPNTDVHNNYFENVASGDGLAISYRYLGNGPFYDNMDVAYNTFSGVAPLEVFTSATTMAVTNILTFRNNNVVDNRTTAYPADGTDGFIRIGHYGGDAQYALAFPLLTFTNNCYYQSDSEALFFSLFGADSGAGGYGPAGNAGDTYSGLAAWQASPGLYDLASSNVDPNYDADDIAQTAACTDSGWNVNYPEEVPAPVSTGTTSGLGWIIKFLRGR